MRNYLGQGEERFTSHRERHFVAVAQEKWLLEVVFELQDLMGECALGDEKFLRSHRKIQCLGQFYEISELSQFHFFSCLNRDFGANIRIFVISTKQLA